MSEAAVVVDAVTKEFRRHDETRNSLKERFVRGRPKGLRTFKAVDNVSFQIPRGSTFGLIGHNGSGKSTMLKMLAGVYRPTSGLIQVDGRVSALLELGAGFHGELTGRENIRLNGAILGFTKEQIESQMEAIIDFADIGDFIDSPVKVYSSGMYVRLGFAVAVMLDPEVLIVDEIIAVGDEEFQRKCFDYLFKLRSRGVTIALVTHSMTLANDLCDDAIWLDHGTQRASGPVRPIVTEYLEEVNRIEAAANAARRDEETQDSDEATGEELEDEAVDVEEERSGHIGTGEARVRGVTVSGAKGVEAGFVSPEERVVLRFEIVAEKEVKNAVVGMGLVTENGIFLTGASSKENQITYDIPKGKSQIDFVMPSLVVQPGLYRIAGSITSQGYTYDYSGSVGELVVRASSGNVEPGFFRLEGLWSEEPMRELDEGERA